MQAIEIVVIIFSIVFVLAVTLWAVFRKKKGKTICNCGACDGNCARCKKAAEQIEKLRREKQNEIQ